MAIERTLSIIKPDAVAKNVIGQIYARFEGAGLKVIAARMAHLSRGEAEAFYAVHKARPFFKDLVEFMISGPVMIQALEGEGAIGPVDWSADGKTLFVNIQHPGEKTPALGAAGQYAFESAWPGNQGYGQAGRPRSATIVIQREDGGLIGL